MIGLVLIGKYKSRLKAVCTLREYVVDLTDVLTLDLKESWSEDQLEIYSRG